MDNTSAILFFRQGGRTLYLEDVKLSAVSVTSDRDQAFRFSDRQAAATTLDGLLMTYPFSWSVMPA